MTKNSDVQISKDDEIALLRHEIDCLKQKLTPSEIAKIVDNSYMSVNNLRAFLQILALIFTVFLAGAISFGWIGIVNIFKIQEESTKIESARLKTENMLGNVANKELELNNNVNLLLDKFNSDLENTRASINNKLDKLIESLQIESKQQLQIVRKDVEGELKELTNEISSVQNELTHVSDAFTKSTIEFDSILTDREKLLLSLLAQKIEPNNHTASIHAARWLALFGEKESSLKYLALLSSRKHTIEVQKEIDEVKAILDKMPLKLLYLLKEPTETPDSLAYNLLTSLYNNKYITNEEYSKILGDAKPILHTEQPHQR